MNDFRNDAFGAGHDHIFLGAAHEQNERRTWMVIALCAAMMVAEVVGGSMFGSLALIADGLHMSTHAGAMLIAALAYTYARKHASDPRFVFGTGKLGDLAGFTSAIVLAMIALLIGYEAVARLLAPVPIHFGEAIPIAVAGLLVNVASVWLLSGDHHGHSHGHGHHHHHGHAHDAHEHEEDAHRIFDQQGVFLVSVFEDGVPPVFRVTPATNDTKRVDASAVSVTTIRPDGTRQTFAMESRGAYLESTDDIPEPHEFKAIVRLNGREHALAFEEHDHRASTAAARDHNIRSAYVHVIADAAVSVLTIVGLLLARAFGWVWMDPLAGIIGALVIANWSYGLMRDTGGILLDMNSDRRLTDSVRDAIEGVGDRVGDLHVWRLGPGHMSAVVSVATADPKRDARFYHGVLQRFRNLSHVTVEVIPATRGQ
ncbi:cation diffusion facilitator transporter family protein [Burkholderia ambifaria AMMD]|uniref:Cation diffusion facilitator family transporter n=1 Tax=Burkholderia ambifaria (strain ATCC BAA-244 / DSM 16087 / CCUG 44356 / LMG 19182 / AMMD) TaxID=339670 RepID=Q0B5G8_BURCM|nr:CDF family Co(II)/Ni(II) efflux transporter DmeF [Burkholderia ambifaria]ABI90605.1 cation diffusion facilitator family transporter [Burkholderia ambifaria AMMD]AJY24804.1 cation diffusion facilitator transporter family protein [Burkholderia ambifaria AMMD]MBR7931621.1 CDF family Co(II)/Ni(II) efflux transporter DmeF [Burkholderia ambifaria]PEH68634.1 cation transporter [Burkholderia ambifaria]QQC06783.1 CDF family Co(II)/Ni(II) efflux transporter DmeF [Burkholderia ambifaria]